MKAFIILTFFIVTLAALIHGNLMRDLRDLNEFVNELKDLELDLKDQEEDEESFDSDDDQEFESDTDAGYDFVNEDKEVTKRADKDFINLALELHNKHRAEHGVGALEIDEGLNKAAQEYADKECKDNVQKHSCGPCDKYGENLAYKASTGDIPKGLEAAKWAVKSWYDEVSLYDFKNPGGGDMHKWGHFTALIWKASKKMGIGVCYGSKTSAKGNKMNTVYVVARYLPPGNMLTPKAMKENVMPKG